MKKLIYSIDNPNTLKFKYIVQYHTSRRIFDLWNPETGEMYTNTRYDRIMDRYFTTWGYQSDDEFQTCQITKDYEDLKNLIVTAIYHTDEII